MTADDVSKARQHMGAAMAPCHLDPLAQERAASMADEGGRSGAQVEQQIAPRIARRRFRWVARVGAWLRRPGGTKSAH